MEFLFGLDMLRKHQVTSGNNNSSQGGASGGRSKDSEFESKVAKLVEPGFERQAVIQALQLFNGNEEQAAGFLFG
ncbi:hypothetical protein RYX36_001635 [Vicia faba]